MNGAIYMITSPTVTLAAAAGNGCSASDSGGFRIERRICTRLLGQLSTPVVSPLPPPYSNNHFLVKLLLDITLLRKECAKGFTPVTEPLTPGVEFGVINDNSGSWEMPGM